MLGSELLGHVWSRDSGAVNRMEGEVQMSQ